MNAKEILIAAKAKIDTPEKWIKGIYAGTHVSYGGELGFSRAIRVTDKPKCFCSIGAVLQVASEVLPVPTDVSYATLLSVTRFDDTFLKVRQLLIDSTNVFLKANLNRLPAVSTFNDNASHEEVMAMFDLAILAAENI